MFSVTNLKNFSGSSWQTYLDLLHRDNVVRPFNWIRYDPRVNSMDDFLNEKSATKVWFGDVIKTVNVFDKIFKLFPEFMPATLD
jgi:hypothetical protein